MTTTVCPAAPVAGETDDTTGALAPPPETVPDVVVPAPGVDAVVSGDGGDEVVPGDGGDEVEDELGVVGELAGVAVAVSVEDE